MNLVDLAPNSNFKARVSSDVILGRDSINDASNKSKLSLKIPATEAGVSRKQCSIQANGDGFSIMSTPGVKNPIVVRTSSGSKVLKATEKVHLSHGDLIEFDVWKPKSERKYVFRVDYDQAAIESSLSTTSSIQHQVISPTSLLDIENNTVAELDMSSPSSSSYSTSPAPLSNHNTSHLNTSSSPSSPFIKPPKPSPSSSSKTSETISETKSKNSKLSSKEVKSSPVRRSGKGGVGVSPSPFIPPSTSWSASSLLTAFATNDPSSSPLETAAALANDETSEVLAIGSEVIVAPRMGKGCNQPGGAARITKINQNENNEVTYDVKYVVSSTREKNLSRSLISTVNISDSNLEHRSRRSMASPSKLPPQKLDPKYWYEGMLVEARYLGKARHYAGVITKIRKDGTFDVHYEDEEAEFKMSPDLIRCIDPSVTVTPTKVRKTKKELEEIRAAEEEAKKAKKNAAPASQPKTKTGSRKSNSPPSRKSNSPKKQTGLEILLGQKTSKSTSSSSTEASSSTATKGRVLSKDYDYDIGEHVEVKHDNGSSPSEPSDSDMDCDWFGSGVVVGLSDKHAKKTSSKANQDVWYCVELFGGKFWEGSVSNIRSCTAPHFTAWSLLDTEKTQQKRGYNMVHSSQPIIKADIFSASNKRRKLHTQTTNSVLRDATNADPSPLSTCMMHAADSNWRATIRFTTDCVNALLPGKKHGEERLSLPTSVHRTQAVHRLATVMMDVKHNGSLAESSNPSNQFKKVEGKLIIPPSGAISSLDELLLGLKIVYVANVKEATAVDLEAPENDAVRCALSSGSASRVFAACEAMKLCMASLLGSWERHPVQQLLTLGCEGKHASRFIVDSCVQIVKELSANGKQPLANSSYQTCEVIAQVLALLFIFMEQDELRTLLRNASAQRYLPHWFGCLVDHEIDQFLSKQPVAAVDREGQGGASFSSSGCCKPPSVALSGVF